MVLGTAITTPAGILPNEKASSVPVSASPIVPLAAPIEPKAGTDKLLEVAEVVTNPDSALYAKPRTCCAAGALPDAIGTVTVPEYWLKFRGLKAEVTPGPSWAEMPIVSAVPGDAPPKPIPTGVVADGLTIRLFKVTHCWKVETLVDP